MAYPKQIGRYEIKRKLRRGGMATVYEAYDPQFQRNVAVKVLRSETINEPNFRARFQREARTIAGLEHPAVVPVYDYGQDGDSLYLVMRLMTGGTLSDRLSKEPLPIELVSHVLTRISRALDIAHGNGIIHRDLKPGNILFDKYGEAYLSDFGIARVNKAAMTLTGTQVAIGTPGYMSPEQIEGKKVDARSDVYALGVLIFEMLTGQQPFAADTPAMMLVRQMTENAPNILNINPNLPAGYNNLISRSLARHKEERPATAGEVAYLLEEATLKIQKVTETTQEASAQDTRLIVQSNNGQSVNSRLVNGAIPHAKGAESKRNEQAEKEGFAQAINTQKKGLPFLRTGHLWIILFLILIGMVIAAVIINTGIT